MSPELYHKQLNHMQRITMIIVTVIIAGFLSSCDDDLRHALDMAGDNRAELEKVLLHFKNDPDPLKYKAARFLIENMPYHYSFDGNGIERYDSAYLAMAGIPLQIRDSILRATLDTIDFYDQKQISDILKIGAYQLIEIINNACDTWNESSWKEDYPEEIFFDYVLPYHIYNEQLSEWQNMVDKEFPYLMSHTIRSKNGTMIQAEDQEAILSPIEETESAYNGKMRILSDSLSSVNFQITTLLPARKYIRLRYTCIDRNVKVRLILNGTTIRDISLDPTYSMKFFNTSRSGIDIDLIEGNNTLSVKHLTGDVGLDYIMIHTVEDTEAIPDEDFSKAYYRIQNKASEKYITFDSLEVLKRTELKELASIGINAILRLDYPGFKCWSISEPSDRSGQLCLETQNCSTDENSCMGQYSYWNGGNQKWIFIPLDNHFFRIMSKDSGLSLEAVTDNDGIDRIIQTSYVGKDSQKWKLEPFAYRKKSNSQFKSSDPMDKAFKVFDVINCFEWISFPSSIMPKGTSLLKGKTGNCREEAAFTVMLCRRLGIPAAVDFTPHWANRSQSHLWSVLITQNGHSIPFYMGTEPGDTVSYFHPYHKPKVFRHRFRINRDIVDDFREENEYPALFHNPDFIDVTDEYYITTDIVREVPADAMENTKVAYICVFDNCEWIPVFYGKISSEKVTFKSMVRNVTYMAATYRNGKIRPFGNPFILDSDGNIKELKTNSSVSQKMTILRKYPFMGEQDQFNWRMNRGIFQGSVSSNFSKTQDLHRHDGKRISGKVIGSSGIKGKNRDKVFDGDILTGFEGESPDGHWVGLKFDGPTRIGMIRYIGRNDGNCIEIGDEYELMFWNEGIWTSLGKRVAKTNTLEYTGIPSGGLYVLHNLTKGHEERIFTYEDGKQVWW